MDYEAISTFLLSTFHLTDYERTWLESKFSLSEDDVSMWHQILKKYHLINQTTLD